MAMVGIPPPLPHSAEFTVIHGLRAAVEALTEPSEQQKARIAAKRSVTNRCRVICITSARDDDSMMSLEEIFITVVGQQNRVAASKGLLKIDQCHLVVINLHPTNLESLVSSKPLRDLNGVVRSEVHTVRANEFSAKLTHLILRHYDLASTTVTGECATWPAILEMLWMSNKWYLNMFMAIFVGIPMKEEQNASSSANYDVEIFHARRSHSILLGNDHELPTSIKDGAQYETVTLKWCLSSRGATPIEPQTCLAQYRITPVDVTSRPSSCLINFLLNGRSVLLEMPRYGRLWCPPPPKGA